MKSSLVLAAALLFAALAAPVAQAQQTSFPPGFVPIEMKRWMSDSPHPWDIVTAPPNTYAPPFFDRGHLGWLSTNAFAGSHALYVCQRKGIPYDLFTSVYEHCEGDIRVQTPYVLGYIASSQIPGTVPLYRCVAGKNEFDSIDPNCEGFMMIGPLGFIFP